MSSPPPPPPAMMASSPPPPPAPVGAETGLPLPGGYFGQPAPSDEAPMPPATPASPALNMPPAPKRKSRFQLQLEMFVDAWLPMPVRVVGGILAIVGIGAGFAVAVGITTLLAGESSSQRTLVIRSTPPGASVTVDTTRLTGVTPLIADLDLDDGQHTVRIALPTGQPALRPIMLAKGDRSVVLSENLQSAGSVRIDTVPPRARILIDGQDVGVSPVTVPNVSTDRTHMVEARRAGYQNSSAAIPVDRAAEHQVRLVLESLKAQGKVVITAALPGRITMDGQPWGMTSSSERDCAPGRHDVAVVFEDVGVTKVMNIDVPERGVARFFVSLEPG
jgi:hypothetical protein